MVSYITWYTVTHLSVRILQSQSPSYDFLYPGNTHGRHTHFVHHFYLHVVLETMAVDGFHHLQQNSRCLKHKCRIQFYLIKHNARSKLFTEFFFRLSYLVVEVIRQSSRTCQSLYKVFFPIHILVLNVWKW